MLRFLAFVALGLAAAGALSAATPAQGFLAANAAVMGRMMKAMEGRAEGDVDADFLRLMEPHHQAGIEMAELELRYGRNEQLRRIAQEIIVEQQQEIAAMRLALGRPLPGQGPPPAALAPFGPLPDLADHHSH